MEFWGVEVQAGKPVKVTPEDDTLVHISQVSLGDCKSKKGETVPLYVKVGDQKLVMGTLSTESIPQISCDLVFHKEFELSHNWGKGSVYFVGYKSPNIDQEGGEYFSDSEEEEEEEVPATITANGNAAKLVAKQMTKPAEVKKNVMPESADDDDDDDDDEEDESDSDGMDEDDSEEEEETLKKKHESNKKRANEAATKTPVSAKKAKATVTPQKTAEKKKDGHATPHPAKKGGKTPTTATQSPKSASQVSCGSCKKTFNSGNALESHNKAKHAAAK